MLEVQIAAGNERVGLRAQLQLQQMQAPRRGGGVSRGGGGQG